MTRVEVALAEIGRRRALAQAATPSGWVALIAPSFSDWSYVRTQERVDAIRADRADASHIAANDPAHVLAVLDAAESALRRHSGPHRCQQEDARWVDQEWHAAPCRDAAAVLDLYAPEATP